MEIEEKKLLDDFYEGLGRMRYFTMLKKVEGKENRYTVEVKVSGFNELNLMVCDILKVCVQALEGDPPYISDLIPNPEINIMGLLELALQLMPNDLEVLDELHEMHLKINKLKNKAEV